jgi:hypothetical protein
MREEIGETYVTNGSTVVTQRLPNIARECFLEHLRFGAFMAVNI